MTTASEPTTTEPTAETIQLEPSFALPIALVLLGVLVFFGQRWVGGSIALFGLFLLFQAATLRLWFTDVALEVYRGETQIRRFPYQDWQNWEIFWSGLPILFYFKEIKSIHFLPILFDPKLLRTCLEQRCPTSASAAIK